MAVNIELIEKYKRIIHMYEMGLSGDWGIIDGDREMTKIELKTELEKAKTILKILEGIK
jgi:hypothetical protein